MKAFIRPSNAGDDADNGVARGGGGGNDADDEESTVAMLPPHIVLSRLLGLPGYDFNDMKKLKKKQKPTRIQLREECKRRYDNSNDSSKPSIPNRNASIPVLVKVAQGQRHYRPTRNPKSLPSIRSLFPWSNTDPTALKIRGLGKSSGS